MFFPRQYYSTWIGVVYILYITVQVTSELNGQEISTEESRGHRLTRESEDHVDPISYPGCGKQDPKLDTHEQGSRKKRSGDTDPTRIGGTESKRNAWPWLVVVNLKHSGGICAGSLISRRYVLTAARCTPPDYKDPEKFSITVDSYKVDDGTDYDLESILVHPDFKPPERYNDISILKTVKPVVLSEGVKPVCLPSKSVTDQIAQINNEAGFGVDEGPNRAMRRDLFVDIVPLEECNQTYYKQNKQEFPLGITDLLICAGGEKGGEDSCWANGGAPLVTQLEGGVWVQIGVFSLDDRCEGQVYTAVYTRVLKYMEFIYNNTDLGKS